MRIVALADFVYLVVRTLYVVIIMNGVQTSFHDSEFGKQA